VFADTKNGKEKVKQVFQDFLRGEEVQDEELQVRKKMDNQCGLACH